MLEKGRVRRGLVVTRVVDWRRMSCHSYSGKRVSGEEGLYEIEPEAERPEGMGVMSG